MAVSKSESRYSRLRRDSETEAARFPALLAEAERIAATIAHGVHGRRQAGSGETFWQYRFYHNQDSAQSIDWRRSARDDNLYVRETERDSSNAVFFWADNGQGMTLPSAHRHTKNERGVVCLMALASLLSRGGERVGAVGAGRARSGQFGLQRTARVLADGQTGVDEIEAANMPRYARLVLASDFLDPIETWQARLSKLSTRGIRGALVHVIAPEEEDFPFQGRTRFKAPEAATPLVFGRAQDIRQAYREQWARHMHDLTTLARQYGFILVHHRIDKPAASAVLALYQALSGDL